MYNSCLRTMNPFATNQSNSHTLFFRLFLRSLLITISGIKNICVCVCLSKGKKLSSISLLFHFHFRYCYFYCFNGASGIDQHKNLYIGKNYTHTHTLTERKISENFMNKYRGLVECLEHFYRIFFRNQRFSNILLH